METIVVERNLQSSLCRRMVLCRCGRVNSQATSPPGFGWVTTAVPLAGLWSSARGTGPRAGWASRWPQPYSVMATTLKVLPHLKIYTTAGHQTSLCKTVLPSPSLRPWEETRHPFKAAQCHPQLVWCLAEADKLRQHTLIPQKGI